MIYDSQKIIPVEIQKEMKKSYIDYAMSVIVGRALPDVRDGLKPVHRRILYTMYEDNLTYDRPLRKSATTVGACLLYTSVYISMDEKMIVTIKCGMSEFNIVAFAAEDFPSLPDVIPDNRMQIQKKTLKSIIRQTSFAVSTTENNTIHTGSKFDYDGEYLTVVSVDGCLLYTSLPPELRGLSCYQTW